MMSAIKPNTPLTDEEKQIQPMPGEIDPKDVKLEVFMAMRKSKQRFKKNKNK